MLKRFRGRRSSNPPLRPETPGRAREPGFDWKSFDAIASDYERIHAPHTAEVGRDLLHLAGLEAGNRILDVGTGTGSLVPEAAAIVKGGVAVGVDPATGMLRAGRAVRPAANLVVADVLDLPFFDESFDVATGNFVLPYFRKLDTALYEVLRVLRPGGRLAASTWTGAQDEFTRAWLAHVEESVGKEVLRGSLKDEAPWAEALADKVRLETVLRDAGLRPVHIERKTYRFHLSREDLVTSLEVEAVGRFVRSMLGPVLWESFRTRVRASFAERFPEHVVDLRDALLAVGTKPV